MTRLPRPRALRFLVLLAVAAALLAALTLAGVLAAKAGHEAGAGPLPPETDLIVVLGGDFGQNPCRLDTDFRTIRGLEVAAEHPDAVFVVSETVGAHPALIEAHVTRLARMLDLPPPATILVEPNAVSTFENVRFVDALLQARAPRAPAIVTDAVHMARARALWWHVRGEWPAYSLSRIRGHPGTAVRYRYYLREAAAWWLNLAKVAGWDALGLIGWSEERRATLIR